MSKLHELLAAEKTPTGAWNQLYETEARKKQSLRAAINAMCKSCIYDKNGSGTWRQQVEACTAPKCPLYPVRPVSTVPPV